MPFRTSAVERPVTALEIFRIARWFVAGASGFLFCIRAGAQADYADPYFISTLAGSPTIAGSADGVGETALFNFPSGIAMDTSGNAYVVDTNNNTIRKIAPGGAVTTLAGTPGRTGSADGIGGSAQFNFGGHSSYPAVDGSGNVYVADTFNSTIRKITPSGQVTTFAGKEGAQAIADGPVALALFSRPTAVAVDGQGNLFVADDGDLVREISNTGNVATLAGNESISNGPQGPADGVGVSATFANIAGIAVNSSGIIFVAETTDVRAILPGAVVTTIAGQSGTTGVADGQGAAARFWGLAGVALDALGNIYVSDSNANNIREISSSGLVTTVAGPSAFSLASNAPAPTGFQDGTGAAALFRSPTGIAADPLGNLYIVDTANSTVRLGRPSIPQESNPAPTPTPTPEPPAPPSGPPTLVTQPAPQTADANSTATFWVLAGGAPGSYQWSFDGAPIPGANFAFYSMYPVMSSDAGSYTVTVSNGLGSVTSAAANLTINAGAAANGGAPDVYGGPPTETVASGATMLFTVLLNGQYPVPLNIVPGPSVGVSGRATTGTTYQWFFGTSPLAGADGPTLMLTGVTDDDSGTYSCLVTNSIGATFTSGTTLDVVQTPDPGRLVNISCRSNVAAGAAQLILGYAVRGGGAGGAEPFLIRASGPALGSFGVTGFLPDPSVTLDASGTTVASDFKWGGSAAISSASSAVGAFAWNDASSLDSALLESLGGGEYTAQIAGASGDRGIALAEVYDDPPGAYSAAEPRLINISSRTEVGTGGDILIAGFVIGGTTSMTVLIRASGPALTQFSVPGVLPDPALSLYRSNSDGTSTLVETNVGWEGSALIASTSASVGAFSWGTVATPDSAIVITLPPGAYTAQVSGALGDTGVALVEVYEVQ